MIIRAIFIDGFGTYFDQSLEKIPEGLVIFQGDNEAGKSTLLGFIRTVLFGFPRKNSSFFYPALAGGVHGGRLEVSLHDGSQVIIARKHGVRGGHVVVTMGDGQARDRAELEAILGGISGPVFHNVYAFSLDELQTFQSLRDEAVNASLYGISTGTTAKALPTALSRIDKECSGYFKSRGSAPQINRKLSELKEIDQKLGIARKEAAGYDEKALELRRQEQEMGQLAGRLSEIKRDLFRFELYRKLWPDWTELNIVEGELNALPGKIGIFPENGLVRARTEKQSLEEARKRVRDFEADIKSSEDALNGIEIDSDVLEQEDPISKLSQEQVRYADSVAALKEEQVRLSDSRKHIGEELSKLGSDWPEQKVMETDLSLFNRQAIRDFESQFEKIKEKTGKLEEQIKDRQERYGLDLDRNRRGREALDRLGTSAPAPDSRILRALQNGRDQFRSLVQDLPELDAQLESATTRLDMHVRSIDPGWATENVEKFDTSVGAHRKAEKAQSRMDTFGRAREQLQQHLKIEESRLEELMEKKSVADKTLRMLAVPAFTSHEEGLRKKELFRKLQRNVKAVNENNAAVEGKTIHYNSLLERRGFTVPGSRAWMTVSLVVSILFGAGAVGMMGWLAFLSGRLPFLSQGERIPSWWTSGLIATCASFFLFLVLLFVFLSARKQRKKAEQLFVSLDGEIQSLKKNLNELEAAREEKKREAENLAGELEIEVPEREEDVQPLEDLLQEDILVLRERQRLHSFIEKLDEEIMERRKDLYQLREQSGEFERKLLESRESWDRFVKDLGFSSKIEPGMARVIFEKIDKAKGELAQVQDLRRRKDLMAKERVRYMSLGKSIPAMADHVAGDPAVFLDAADRFFEREREQEQLRRRIGTEIQRLEEEEAALALLQTEINNKRDELRLFHGEMDQFRKKEWGTWLLKQGLPESLSPETALEAFFSIDRCKQTILEKQNHRTRISSLETFIRDYAGSVSDLALKTGKPEPDPEQIEMFVQSLNRHLKENLKKQSDREVLEKQISGIQGSAGKEERNIDEIVERMTLLYEQGGATTHDDFLHRGKMFEKQESLRKARHQYEDSIRKIAGDPDLETLKTKLKELTKERVEEEVRSLRSEKEEMEPELERLRQEKADLNAELKALQSSDDIVFLRAVEEGKLAELRDMAREWSRWKVAGFLLQKAREKFERDQQPQVIQSSSDYFKRITKGKYSRIVLPVGGETLEVIGSDGTRKEPKNLSRGTREQLYLSIRFGYITQHGHGKDLLPLVMDDILVNFDPTRAREAAKGIASFAESHQVLYFTCHPEIAELLQEESGKSVLYHLENSRFVQTP